ncbi:MAG: hypothetical protein J1E42_08145 [Akkermansiaceae bacterium]|nr:hypothetical protein [Akkermansiaceae bacterium]
MNASSFEYAIRHTRLLYVPYRRIESFGETRFNFRLLSEPMDTVGHCRVRSGWVEAGRPLILKPPTMQGIETEGFSAEAAKLFDWMREQGSPLQALVRYGFQFSRSEVQEEYLHEDIREVADRVVRETENSGDYYRAVIEGVDDTWEVSLLCFMIEIIQQSHEINIFDFKRRGLL